MSEERKCESFQSESNTTGVGWFAVGGCDFHLAAEEILVVVVGCDSKRVVEEGLDGILTEIAEAKREASGQRLDTLRAMEVALRAVVNWADRYARLASELASGEADEAERERLAHIAEICQRMPRLPATNFHEALQSIWFVHAAIGLSEMSGSSPL